MILLYWYLSILIRQTFAFVVGHMEMVTGLWEVGKSAGGSRNNLPLFSTNPQFLLSLSEPGKSSCYLLSLSEPGKSSCYLLSLSEPGKSSCYLLSLSEPCKLSCYILSLSELGKLSWYLLSLSAW